MILAELDKKCNLIRDTTFTTTYLIDFTSLLYLGNGQLLAVGSAASDSANTGASGLLFVWSDTAGTITDLKEIKETTFISANKAIADNSGNIYLALTRKNLGGKSKASVAKYDNLLQKIWEKELYNNPQFGASSLGLALDGTGNVYVSGRTELSVTGGVETTSFLALYYPQADTLRKKYLEDSNSGSSVILNAEGQVMLLNLNCFVINVLNSSLGTTEGIIRPFDACDSKSTDAFGYDFRFNYDGSVLLSGSRGGGFYLALKSYIVQPPL
jgi:hypothetical protein